MPASLDMTTGVDACVHTCGGAELWPNGSMGIKVSGNLYPGCCVPGVAAAPAAGCDSSASSGLPAAHCLHTDVPSANEDFVTDWNSYNIPRGYFAPWMEPDKFSPLAPTQAHIKVSAAAESAFSCGLTEPSREWHRQPCSAGYFSAWLRGECLSVSIPEADSQAVPAKSPASQAFTPPSSHPVRLAASELGTEAHESMRRTAPTLHITVGGPLEDSDSLPSPLGSDCRAPQYACSGYESGRSSSMSLLSWDGRSSGSSGGEHEQDTCWAPTDAALTNGRLQACGEQPRGGGGAREANDCTELLIVDCDVWEREVEAKLSAEANYTISSPLALAPVHPADAAIEADAYLAHMLWTVVTEALFDPCPDTYTTC
ncbi:hypothetical protein Vretimale_18372 [Volvox reticuliferus]|uniref:Uncharacterized protein n=1 Tax=Volvox reticuliferus TaxID=1737510 RepID=A0A8J4FPV1_9CHLO|nr:hypothetical protein Vretifemale_8816 [Volvox reticuliferus]GIM15605.1 hypothetical protein Vretimale_18372 [Volvox reticuliferus]